MEEEIPQEVIERLNLTCITSMLKMSQIQNGLKHASFRDYRRYCTRKIRKMRKKIGLKYGKKKKVNKKIEMIIKDKVEAYWVALYHSERFWANAMELKQDIKNQEKQRKIKTNIKKKLHRSIQWMNLFKVMCEESKVEKITFESQAQVDFLQGLLLIEKENYSEALEKMYKAKGVLSKIATTLGTIEKAHIGERIQQIDNNVRFCKYQMNEFSGNQDEMIELQRAMQSDPTSALKLDDLVGKMNQNKGDEISLKVKLFGNDIEIQEEKLIVFIKKVELIEKGMQQMEEEENGSTLNEKLLSTYINIFTIYDDAVKVCELKMKEGLSEGVQKIWEGIKRFFEAEKLKKVLKRNKIMIGQSIKKFEKENGYEAVFFSKVDYKATRPQNVVKLIDLNLQVVAQLKDWAIEAEEIYSRYCLLDDYFKALRLFYVSCFHISQGNNQYAISLLHNLEKEVEDLTTRMINTNNFEAAEEVKNGLDRISKNSKILRVKSHLTILEEEQKKMEELPEAFENLEVEEGTKLDTKESLLDILKTGKVKSQGLGKGLRPLVNFVPDFKMIPHKPILLDICHAQLEYPNLDEKLNELKTEKKKKKGGLFSKFSLW